MQVLSEGVQQLLASFRALESIWQLPEASDSFTRHLAASGSFKKHLEPSGGFQKHLAAS